MLKYANKVQLVDFNLATADIGDIQTCISRAGKVVYKCSVPCPSCDSKIPCIFNKSWQISNLEKHLKQNYENERKAKEIPITSDKNDEKDEDAIGNIIQTPNASNQNDLNALISDSLVSKNINSSVESEVVFLPLSESFQKSISISNK